MRKKTAKFPSGKLLPDNVYHAQRKSDRDRFYRYRMHDGKIIKLESSCEIEITKWATEANEIRNSRKIKTKTESKNSKNLDKESFGYWVMKFLENYQATSSERERSKDYLYNRIKSIESNFKPLFKSKCRLIQKRYLKECWDKMTYNTQRANRPTLRKLFSELLDSELLPKMKDYNPFVTEPAGGFGYKARAEKKKSILTIEQFLHVQKIAKRMGNDFLVDAMDISFLTYMRLSDVVTLRFSDIEDLQLSVEVGKSKNRVKPLMMHYDLKSKKGLNEVISRAKLRAVRDCPFVISHNTKNNKSKKEHKDQVLQNYLISQFKKTIEIMKKELELDENFTTGFHEIRALRMAVDKSKRDIKEISLDMMHSDIKITKEAYDTHEKYEHHFVSYEPSLLTVENINCAS